MTRHYTAEELLGFSKNEKRLYRVLSETPVTVAKLVRKADVPRMTAEAILERFQKRGIVQRQIREGRRFYLKSNPSILACPLLTHSGLLGTEAVVNLASQTQVQVYKGAKDINTAFRQLFEHSSGERIYVVEPTQSVIRALPSIPRRSIEENNRLIEKSESVFETIVEEDFFESIKAVYKDHFRAWFDVFTARTAVVYVLPKHSMNYAAHFYLFKNTVFIMEWENKTAIEIRDKNVVRMFRSMAEAFKVNSKHTNYALLARDTIGSNSV